MTDLWTSKISEYIDGTLTAADRQAMERHLTDCADCRVILDDLRVVVSQASALVDSPPTSDLWQGVAGRIAGAPDGVYQLRPRPKRGRISFTIPQLVAAGIVLVVLSGAIGRFLANEPAGTDSTGTGIPVVPAATPASGVAVDHALSQLQAILEAGRGNLDSTTVQILELNLGIIDRAIAQARQAVAADPANAYLRDHLTDTMRQKLALMRLAADLVETTS